MRQGLVRACTAGATVNASPARPKQETMNIHHLELFYYVARHGGITEAVRNIPYGIQQPAVSGQVAQLEEYLGVTLVPAAAVRADACR